MVTFCEQHQLRFMVLFGSRARRMERAASDLDLALMPLCWPDDTDAPWNLSSALTKALRRSDLDVAWLPYASWLLWWEVARDGILLYENCPGQYRSFQIVAALRRADSRLWRQRDHCFLQRVLEGSWDVNAELIRRKLTVMGQYLRELEQVLTHGRKRFLEEFQVHRTAERQLELLVECAAAINTEVAQAVGGIPPSDYYSSFFSLSSTGWLDAATAQELATVAGLRNRLVHQYEDIELPRLYQATKKSVRHWRRYVTSILRNLEEKDAERY